MRYRLNALQSLGPVTRRHAPAASRHHGLPVPEEVRRRAEELLGENLSDVRIIVAARVEQLGARAFTSGSRIYVAPREYQPDSERWLRLLGHELAHVVQQRRGQARNPHGHGVVAVRDASLEAQAERVGMTLQRMLRLPEREEGSSEREEAIARYNASGVEKWREFIDAKDHEAALLRESPGTLYDYRESLKIGDFFQGFLDADAFVASRIGTRLSARDYLGINMLAMQSNESQKGFRDGTVTWRLQEVTEEEELELLSKGLTTTPAPEGNGIIVSVPMPDEEMSRAVQTRLDTYYAARARGETALDQLMAVVDLYQSLEALHAFKDGTSRTNHLVLNQLLTELGLSPAILDQPDSPTRSREDWARKVVEASRRGQRLAQRQGPRSVESLLAERAKVQKELKVDERMAKLGMKPSNRFATWQKWVPRSPGKPVPILNLSLESLERELNRLPEPVSLPVVTETQETREPPRFMPSSITVPLDGLDALLARKVFGPRKAQELFKVRRRPPGSDTQDS